MSKSDKDFIVEHIENRKDFDECLKEETPQMQASKAFYNVWSNYIFINPTTENLRNLEPENYTLIKKLSYGAKNRLQSFIAYHLNTDHYEMQFSELDNKESDYVVELCRSVYENTKILIDWWRKPLNEEQEMTGEGWFQECKERFQKQKHIDRAGFVFIDLNKRQFLKIENDEIYWTNDDKQATRFNKKVDDIIMDQNDKQIENAVSEYVREFLNRSSMKGLKVFITHRKETDSNFII